MLHPFKWRQEQERIRDLRKEILNLGDFPPDFRKAFAYAAKVYNICSFFEDEGLIQFAPTSKKGIQAKFNKLITDAGRSGKHNRTERGEQVTTDNTFWGGIYSINTWKTGSYWAQSEAPCLCFEASKKPPTSAQVLVDFQVRPATTNHRSQLLEVCDKLLD